MPFYVEFYQLLCFSDTVPVGSIVGGVLGGVCALAAVVIIVLFILLFVLRHKCPVKRLLNSKIRNKEFVSTVAYGKLLAQSDDIDSQ